MSELRSVSRTFLSEFISLYRSKPCLWKIKSKEYMDREKKQLAYEELRVKLLEVDPRATKDKVVRKINSLRTCFRKEVVKVIKSRETAKRPEEVRRPSLWYFEDLTFLIDQEQPPSKKVHKSMSSEEEVSIEEDSKNLGILSVVDQSEIMVSREESTSSPPCSRKKRRVDDAPNSVAMGSEEGRFSMFGKLVAQELEGLPHEKSLYCKRVINEAIFEAQMGTLNRTSRVVTDEIVPQADDGQRDPDLAPSWFIKKEPLSTTPEVPSEQYLVGTSSSKTSVVTDDLVPQVDDRGRDSDVASRLFIKRVPTSTAFEVSSEQDLEQFRNDDNDAGESDHSDHVPPRLRGKHFIQKIPPSATKPHPQRRCAVCSYRYGKRKDTVYWCKKCDVGLCFDCFEDYHTKEHY